MAYSGETGSLAYSSIGGTLAPFIKLLLADLSL